MSKILFLVTSTFGQFGEAIPRTCHKAVFCENTGGLSPAFVYVRAQPRCVLYCGVCYPRVTLICQVTPTRCTSTLLRVRDHVISRLHVCLSKPFPNLFVASCRLSLHFTVLLAFRAIFIRTTFILQKFLVLMDTELSDGFFTIS